MYTHIHLYTYARATLAHTYAHTPTYTHTLTHTYTQGRRKQNRMGGGGAVNLMAIGPGQSPCWDFMDEVLGKLKHFLISIYLISYMNKQSSTLHII